MPPTRVIRMQGTEHVPEGQAFAPDTGAPPGGQDLAALRQRNAELRAQIEAQRQQDLFGPPPTTKAGRDARRQAMWEDAQQHPQFYTNAGGRAQPPPGVGTWEQWRQMPNAPASRQMLRDEAAQQRHDLLQQHLQGLIPPHPAGGAGTVEQGVAPFAPETELTRDEVRYRHEVDVANRPFLYTLRGSHAVPPRGTTWEEWATNPGINQRSGVPTIGADKLLKLEMSNAQRRIKEGSPAYARAAERARVAAALRQEQLQYPGRFDAAGRRLSAKDGGYGAPGEEGTVTRVPGAPSWPSVQQYEQQHTPPAKPPQPGVLQRLNNFLYRANERTPVFSGPGYAPPPVPHPPAGRPPAGWVQTKALSPWQRAHILPNSPAEWRQLPGQVLHTVTHPWEIPGDVVRQLKNIRQGLDESYWRRQGYAPPDEVTRRQMAPATQRVTPFTPPRQPGARHVATNAPGARKRPRLQNSGGASEADYAQRYGVDPESGLALGPRFQMSHDNFTEPPRSWHPSNDPYHVSVAGTQAGVRLGEILRQRDQDPSIVVQPGRTRLWQGLQILAAEQEAGGAGKSFSPLRASVADYLDGNTFKASGVPLMRAPQSAAEFYQRRAQGRDFSTDLATHQFAPIPVASSPYETGPGRAITYSAPSGGGGTTKEPAGGGGAAPGSDEDLATHTYPPISFGGGGGSGRLGGPGLIVAPDGGSTPPGPTQDPSDWVPKWGNEPDVPTAKETTDWLQWWMDNYHGPDLWGGYYGPHGGAGYGSAPPTGPTYAINPELEKFAQPKPSAKPAGPATPVTATPTPPARAPEYWMTRSERRAAGKSLKAVRLAVKAAVRREGYATDDPLDDMVSGLVDTIALRGQEMVDRAAWEEWARSQEWVSPEEVEAPDYGWEEAPEEYAGWEGEVAVKAVDGQPGRFVGQLIRWGSPDEADISSQRDFFTPATDLGLDWYGPDAERPLFYHHAMDEGTKDKPKIGSFKVLSREDGIWIDGQIDQASKYAERVNELLKRGVIKLSTDSAPHLIVRTPSAKGTNRLDRFPILGASATVSPAEWRLGAVTPIN